VHYSHTSAQAYRRVNTLAHALRHTRALASRFALYISPTVHMSVRVLCCHMSVQASQQLSHLTFSSTNSSSGSSAAQQQQQQQQQTDPAAQARLLSLLTHRLANAPSDDTLLQLADLAGQVRAAAGLCLLCSSALQQAQGQPCAVLRVLWLVLACACVHVCVCERSRTSPILCALNPSHCLCVLACRRGRGPGNLCSRHCCRALCTACARAPAPATENRPWCWCTGWRASNRS